MLVCAAVARAALENVPLPTSPPNRSRDPIAKAMGALAWMVQDSAPDVGVRELAAGISVSPSSAHRLLSALVEVGFVRKNPETARYSLGLEFLRLCHAATARLPITQLALPHLTDLADACSETVLLGIYDRERAQVMFAATVDAPHPLRYIIELNTWLPLHAGSSGLAIMAFLPEAEVEALIAAPGGIAQVTSETVTDPVALKKMLLEVRKRGYAITHGQRIHGAVGIAAPFLSGRGEVLGDVVVTIPEQRFDPAREKEISELVMACARKVSAEFGHDRNAIPDSRQSQHN